MEHEQATDPAWEGLLADISEVCESYDIRNPKQRAVLAAAVLTPYVYPAAKAAGVSPGTVYAWLGRMTPERFKNRKSEAFIQAWSAAEDMAFSLLEREAHKRAGAGISDRHSADLLKFLMSSNRVKYQPHSKHSLGGMGGTKIVTEITLHKGEVEK